MASIKKKSSGGGGANWMDTYGDMVTLLLCFFVLLYSISTISQEKWMLVVKSFNRDAVTESTDPPGPIDGETGEKGNDLPLPDMNNEVDEALLDDLYDFLVEYAAEQNQSGEGEQSTISVSQGDDFIFISFDDAIFFGGNSSVLRAEGKALLDDIVPALAEAAPMIDELKVLGHTAQQYADTPNRNVHFDRMLASNRATEVVVYLQERIGYDVLNPGRLVVESFGQWRNIAPNDVEANRAKNRRVELVISGRDLENPENDEFEDYFAMYETLKEENIPSYSTNGN